MKKNLIFLFVIFTLILQGCSNSTKSSKEEKVEDFPSKPITLIVPFAEGAIEDVRLRIIAEKASENLPNKEPIIVKNIEGGLGVVGTSNVIKAKADGYTIGSGVAGALSIQTARGDATYDVDDLQPIVRIASGPLVLLVKEDSPLDDFDAWLNHVEENPGTVSYGWVGLAYRVVMEKLKLEADIELKNVPYDSDSIGVKELIGGEIDGLVTTPSIAEDYIESGDVKPILLLGSDKIDADNFKDVPTAKEKGFELNLQPYSGIIGPEDLPEDKLNILYEAFESAINDEEVMNQLEKSGLSIDLNLGDPDEFRESIKDGYDTAKEVLDEIEL